MDSLSIFFPCYNDEKTIGGLVTQSAKVARKLTRNFEVIVIDDASTDGSRALLKKLVKKYKYLRVVMHEKNQGYGGALQSGFKAAKKDLVFYTDGDGQYDVSELDILYRLMTPDVSFVQGLKMDRQDYSYRVIVGNLYAFTTRWLFGLKTWDVDCDFRLIRKSIYKKLNLNCRSGAVCVELVKRAENAKAKIRHVGVHHYSRRFGNSQFFKPARILHTFWELFTLWPKVMLYGKS